MNIMMKTLLSTAAFVGFVSVAHATNGPNQRHHCDVGALCTAADIPVELKVDPNCELTVSTSKIVLAESGGVTSGSRDFNVKANYDYKIKVTTDNMTSPTATNLTNGLNTIATSVATTGGLQLGSTVGKSMPTAAGDNYTVTFTTAEDYSMKPVGNYTDTYHISIYF